MDKAKISERENRLLKLKKLFKEGINPFPAKAERSHTIDKLLSDFDKFKKSQNIVTIAGRLRGMRGHGNLTFANLEDDSGNVQLAISKNNVGAEIYKRFTKAIDVGDFIQASGKCFFTHKNEQTIMIDSWKLLAKALRPLPEKWHGLQDEEEKLRKRYLGLLFDNDLKQLFIKKATFWQAARTFMLDRGFLEVETPVLEYTTGGADARPFITQHNALNSDVYLRISMGELWQKRLMVAGFEKTFEIGRQFRNEGMDGEHLQDYTQMEFYWAYADFNDGMKLVEELFKHLALTTFKTLQFQIGKYNIDLGKKWEHYDYTETIKKYTDINIQTATLAMIEKKLKELKIVYDKKGFNITRAIDNLWKYCRRNIVGPGFLINLPAIVSPLAKRIEERPDLVQKFQPIIAGSELGNGYSELNDPLDQAQRFTEQAKLREQGDEEAQMYDADFIEALEYGMPPTCGFGMSERVFAFLADKNVRECQLFPLMKPKDKPGKTNY